MVCKHRVAYRIVEIYSAMPEPTTPAPVCVTSRIIRSIEFNYRSSAITVERCNGWLV